MGSRLAASWFLISTALLVWPVYPWLGNHVEPRLLGLPWSLTWVLLVISANFGVLLVLYRLRAVDDAEVCDAQPDQAPSSPGAKREAPPR